MSPIPHGTVDGYRSHGCRCRECRGANAAMTRAYRAQHASLAVDGVHPHAPHGTSKGYEFYRCRCEPCKVAKRAHLKQWRACRYSERQEIDGRLVHPSADHGTSYAYSSLGCRCGVCSAHEKARRAARYQRRKSKHIGSDSPTVPSTNERS